MIPKKDAKAEKQTYAQKCLACHGSFDKLAEKTANFKAPSGETTSPHRYVPHTDKTDIPNALNAMSHTRYHWKTNPMPSRGIT